MGFNHFSVNFDGLLKFWREIQDGHQLANNDVIPLWYDAITSRCGSWRKNLWTYYLSFPCHCHSLKILGVKRGGGGGGGGKGGRIPKIVDTSFCAQVGYKRSLESRLQQTANVRFTFMFSFVHRWEKCKRILAFDANAKLQILWRN